MIILYDGTFEGFLTVVFDCYEQRLDPELIHPVDDFQHQFLTMQTTIATDEKKAQRVWTALQKKMGANLDQLPYLAFLSHQNGIEMNLLRFIRKAFASNQPIDGNYSDQDVLTIRKASRLVTREAMRLMQFIRFQKTLDNIYFAAMVPDYDVLFMVLKHFSERFADQQWIVYDLKRDYGYFYDLKKIEEITLSDKMFNLFDGSLSAHLIEEDEKKFQTLWQNYCKNITIRERLNPKVHKQHLPKRYWRFLVEKR